MRFAVLIALAAVAPVGCSDPKEPVQERPVRPRIAAHRGASADAPENTLAAFRRAWHLGVEAVELDVHVTKDGEVVVMHDANTRRTAGLDKPIAEQTLAELKLLDAGAWKGPAFVGERIPTLGEVLATIPPGRSMFVEIKSPVDTAGVIAEAVKKGKPSNASILLQGFDPDVLGTLAAALPEAPAYWTVDPPLDHDHLPLPYRKDVIDEAKRRGFAGVALDYRGVDEPLLVAARDAGILVDVWTLNETALLASWLERDVRWVETDRPDLAPARSGPNQPH